MISNDVESLFGQRRLVMLQNSIHEFVVTPRHGQIGNSTVGLVDSKLGAEKKKLIITLRSNHYFSLVSLVIAIHIALETLRSIDDIFRPFAAHRESVTDHSPLWFTVECHHFAQIVNESGQMEPVFVGEFLACSLSCLKCVNDIGKSDIRIRFVHQIVELLECLTNRCGEVVELEPFSMAS